MYSAVYTVYMEQHQMMETLSDLIQNFPRFIV